MAFQDTEAIALPAGPPLEICSKDPGGTAGLGAVARGPSSLGLLS